jgi:hypothetical protein
VYVADFKAKQEMALVLETGRIYEAINDGSFINIILPENNQFIVSSNVTDNENFYCNLIAVTAENRATLKELIKEDRELVEKHFAGVPIVFNHPNDVREFVQGLQKEHMDAERQRWEETINLLGKIQVLDGNTFGSIHALLGYIGTTFEDKYEVNFPEVDLHGLKFTSPHGLGFNMGNVAKYVKRYMTTGFGKSGKVDDLYKAVHYLLYEIARAEFTRKNQPPKNDKKA